MVRYWMRWMGRLLLLSGLLWAGLFFMRPPVTPWEIAYTRFGEHGLDLMYLDVWTGESRLLSDVHPPAGGIRWSADGDVLSFLYTLPQDPVNPFYRQIIHVESGRQDIQPRIDLRTSHTVSPDRRHKLLQHYDPVLNRYDYVLLSMQRTSAVLLHQSDTALPIAWSPDSRYVAYSFQDISNYLIMRVQDVTCAPRCPPRDLYRAPNFGIPTLRWLDNTQVMYFAADLSSAATLLALHQVRIADGQQQVLLRLPLEAYPVWPPNETLLYVMNNAYTQPSVTRIDITSAGVIRTEFALPPSLGVMVGNAFAGEHGLYLPLGFNVGPLGNTLYYLDGARGTLVPLSSDTPLSAGLVERPQS
jgi:hypothetical protein